MVKGLNVNKHKNDVEDDNEYEETGTSTAVIDNKKKANVIITLLIN